MQAVIGQPAAHGPARQSADLNVYWSTDRGEFLSKDNFEFGVELWDVRTLDTMNVTLSLNEANPVDFMLTEFQIADWTAWWDPSLTQAATAHEIIRFSRIGAYSQHFNGFLWAAVNMEAGANQGKLVQGPFYVPESYDFIGDGDQVGAIINP